MNLTRQSWTTRNERTPGEERRKVDTRGKEGSHAFGVGIIMTDDVEDSSSFRARGHCLLVPNAFSTQHKCCRLTVMNLTPISSSDTEMK
jgi:hypothetical protein